MSDGIEDDSMLQIPSSPMSNGVGIPLITNRLRRATLEGDGRRLGTMTTNVSVSKRVPTFWCVRDILRKLEKFKKWEKNGKN
jgi:hypothetical protein